MQIIPAILPKTRDELIEKLGLLRDAGFSGHIQIDMCDGVYVDAKTWPFADELNNTQTSFEIVNGIAKDKEVTELLSYFAVDLDLMVTDPGAGMIIWDALSPDRIIIHLGSLKKESDIEYLSVLLAPQGGAFDVINRKAIVFAFSLNTDIEKFAYWYDNFAMRHVQIMGIEHVGHQGEEFSSQTFDMIEKLRARYENLEIMVDGGVSISNLERLSQYGVTACVAGSAVFKNNVVLQNLHDLQNVL